jgi:hypothetical protein
VRAPFAASSAMLALNATSWFLRIDMSVLILLEDQQRSDHSFRHFPIFGGQFIPPLHPAAKAG